MTIQSELRGKQSVVVALSFACVCAAAAAPAWAQSADSTQQTEPSRRLLTVEEGRSIVDAAQELEQPAGETLDCSHVIHEIYLSEGFEYPYASSFEIYAGNANFARIRFPRAGDLIVWPGHVGIVVDPLQHSFYSQLSTGWLVQNYRTPYWKSRGSPRFYRYRKLDSEGVWAATPSLVTKKPRRGLASSGSVESALLFPIPSSIVVAAGSKPPTRKEVVEGISELSDAAGNVLRTDDSLNIQPPIVVFEEINVERVEIKKDHGWARVALEVRVSIHSGTPRLDRRRQKVNWELRRGVSGWEAVMPTDRVYVPYDVAVKNLAAQLSRLAESDNSAAQEQGALLRESRIANLLSALLEPQDLSGNDAQSSLESVRQ